MPKRQLTGKIVSDKMQKTVVVRVERIKIHPKYKKRYKFHNKYKAHDEKREYKVGDTVVIEECKPISKDKKWRVIKKIENRK
ncbi:MAG: 30S ribosomal protein S17 [Candidatus Wildermuthbacteria bacterium RIFCSPLOWO2_12_FULL_40_9]|uniref:Small ribosomal subunit protein uS17 n=2 Tax=Candidatus Wildermuthiibacteriota TaxID=1817923 RepID=A0A1G2RC91_9BACT|nr:MAG: 30S ribosomal protein S17 [Candidatus Wildermuthbacteria bacterium RIFCSPHIGHO2_12_FULL_40_12]OHA76448.1 MAG: 30S ribosomal protein S17 [Candidatus Wildermuthbacteria bacterium RIFCSPLOWO2_12_FULL_40_9]